MTKEVKRPVQKGFPNQGLTFCRPGQRQPRIGKIEGTHCSECGFRVRGSNHKNGTHHLSKKKII